jgi:hypothetical protein
MACSGTVFRQCVNSKVPTPSDEQVARRYAARYTPEGLGGGGCRSGNTTHRNDPEFVLVFSFFNNVFFSNSIVYSVE